MASRYKSIYAIGDIHGCNVELQLLLKQLPLSRDTLVVFLGDYVDRGGQSKQVIETILELRQRVPVVTLMGNHEALFLDFIDHPESAGAGVFIFNGGSATLVSYQTTPGRFEIPPEHDRFLRELRLYYETEDYFFVHAGVPDVPLHQLSTAENGAQMLWIRSSFLASRYDWKKKIVHGHTPVLEPEIRTNRINLDTGCVFNGALTAIELPSQRIFTVEKQDKVEAAPFLRNHSHESRVAARFHGALKVTVARGVTTLEFETLNYNEFGLLIRESISDSVTGRPSLQVGDIINGVIGTQNWVEIRFDGEVVRTETRGDDVLYGVRV
ncbi:MAG: serine/threonine protein phosphatase, partial [Bdellovibrionaceae bacterium]|nr:serine/threonine protein phosphatase [Pseudobdellovibrionaceae bacterium]